MSVHRSISSRTATRTAWTTLAALFMAVLLYENHARIVAFAKTLMHEDGISKNGSSSGDDLRSSAPSLY